MAKPCRMHPSHLAIFLPVARSHIQMVPSYAPLMAMRLSVGWHSSTKASPLCSRSSYSGSPVRVSHTRTLLSVTLARIYKPRHQPQPKKTCNTATYYRPKGAVGALGDTMSCARELPQSKLLRCMSSIRFRAGAVM